MNLGGSGYSRALDQVLLNAMSDKDIVFSIAVGDSGLDSVDYTPVSTQHPKIVTISAFSEGASIASFSNFANHQNYQRSDVTTIPTEVEFAMPVGNVFSTKTGGGTVAYNGTSMAAPHFCGVVLVQGTSNFVTAGVVLDGRDNYPDPIAVK